MWSRVWNFLRDKGNRGILTFLGGVALLVTVVLALGSILIIFFYVPSGNPLQPEDVINTILAKRDADQKAAEAAMRDAEQKAAEAAMRDAEQKAAEAAMRDAEQKAAEAAMRDAEQKAAEAAMRDADQKAAEAAMRPAEQKAAEAAKRDAEQKAVEAAKRREAEQKAAEAAKRREAEQKAPKHQNERPLRRAEPIHASPRTVPPPVAEPARRKILETGYSLLKDIGGEEPGYGLYSYAILVNDNDRSAKFLGHVFGDGFNAIPPVEETAAPRSQTNIFYIPLKKDKAGEWSEGLKLGTEAVLRAGYANSFYDYKMARTLLDHLCDPPAKEIKRMCEGDLSRGPYIFAYAQPASIVTPVPPPFLFIDLSDAHERAFPEFIAAFKSQVKREDISDRAKIRTLRLRVGPES